MKSFNSAQQMLDAHEAMFGECGRICAELVIRHADTLFDHPLATLNFRIVLAPIELGPYNRHMGYIATRAMQHFILGNRHIVKLSSDGLIFTQHGHEQMTDHHTEDFIVHELTHRRQNVLLAQHRDWAQTRGAHRGRGWFAAIEEAAPRYLGVGFPASRWPKRSTQQNERDGRLTEVEVCHWPTSFRRLITSGDVRLAPVRHELMTG